MYERTIWQTEPDGLTHGATVKGNDVDGCEIRSDCGLVGQACWEKQLEDDAEVTCPRCRSIGRANQAGPRTEAGREQSTGNPGNGKPEGHPSTPGQFQGADLIHVYTRRQAIEDGVLIDVTPTAKEVGIPFPTALTRAVWQSFVRVPAGVQAQDEPGRLWDLLLILRCAIQLSPGGNTVHFYFHVRNANRAAKRHLLKAVCGPDDDGSPCLTVMLPTED